MNERTALVPLTETMQLGEILAKSGFFEDSRQAAQAVVKVLAGQEIGIGPIAAMTGIFIVKGKPTIGANVQAAAVKRSGKYNYRIRAHDDSVCRIEFFERAGQGWESLGFSQFTRADAVKAGTQNLEKFARNMLFARAISNGVKWFCPDIFNGAPVYTPEEMGVPVDGEGEIIEGSYNESPPQLAAPDSQPTPVTVAAANGFDELVPAREERAPAAKPKLAVIRTPAFAAQVAEFATATPYYQDKGGKPDAGHILGAAVKLGFNEITTENIGQVWGALRQYAYEQQQPPKA
jgi:hypothetical protein